MADEIIVVEPVIPVINIINQKPSVVISAPGPQGPAGTFTPADIAYVHTQAVSSAVWTINHNLNFNPVCVVLDSAGTNVEGTISYPSINQMVITFTSAFSGTAYLV